jgi:hypothetical protein
MLRARAEALSPQSPVLSFDLALRLASEAQVSLARALQLTLTIALVLGVVALAIRLGDEHPEGELVAVDAAMEQSPVVRLVVEPE